MVIYVARARPSSCNCSVIESFSKEYEHGYAECEMFM